MYNKPFSQTRFSLPVFWCIAIALVVVCPFGATAQRKWTLSQAINNALNNRKNVQAGRQDATIRKLQTEALYRKFWPQITADYSYQYNPILQTSILPIGVFNPSYPADATKSVQFGTRWSQTAGVTVNQPLFDVSPSRQISEARLQERITAAAQAQTEYELTYTVAQVYFDIAIATDKIASAVADTNRTWISYQLLNSSMEQGRLLKTELNKGKINHNNAVQQYLAAVAQMVEDKVYLLFLVGENDIDQPDFTIDTALLKKDELPLTNKRPDAATIPELQQLELQQQLTHMQARTEKASYLPTLGLKGYLGANQYSNDFDPIAANSWFGVSYVGINLKYPLLFGDDRRRKLQQLTLQGTQYEQQKDDRTAQYQKDAVVAKIKMEQIASALKTQEENKALSMESIGILQTRLTEGQETTTTINQEEADLQKLIADYQANQKQYWLYYLDYLKASGRLEVLWK